jgi:predicted dehydrogenase
VANSSASRERAGAGGAASIIPSLDEMPEVEGLVVASPTSTHAEVVSRALDFEVPVFVEKPLTVDPIAAEKLAARAPDRLFVMDKWRYHAGVEKIAAMARSGEYGALQSIHSWRLSTTVDHTDVDSVWILLPHDLAIIVEIAGGLPGAISADGARGEGPDARLTGVLGPAPECVVEVSGMSPVHVRRLQVRFAGALVVLDGAYADSLRVAFPGGTEVDALSVPLPDDLPLLAELTAFIEHLRGGPPPRSSAEVGASAVRRIAELLELAGM